MGKKKLILLSARKKAWCVAFNGTSTSINAGSEASIDNLTTGIITVELYVNTPIVAEQMLIRKEDKWLLYVNGLTLQSEIDLSVTNAVGYVGSAGIANAMWHHVAFTYSHTGDKKIRQFVDGILISTGTAGDGDVVDDAAKTLFIGSNSGVNTFLTGNLGWIRISNSIRYTGNYTLPSRLLYPAVDVNTVRLFKMNEGTGTSIIDYSSNAQNATLSNGTWIKL